MGNGGEAGKEMEGKPNKGGGKSQNSTQIREIPMHRKKNTKNHMEEREEI